MLDLLKNTSVIYMQIKWYNKNMSRRKKLEKDKRKPFNISLPKELKEEFIKECEKRGDIPSHLVREMIEKYLNK